MRIALQMISVKDRSPGDLCEVIHQVGAIGYQGVEFARGFYGKTPEEVAAALRESGMEAVGEHASIEELETDLDGVLDRCALLSMRQVTPLGGVEQWMNAEQAARYLARIRALGERMLARGVKLALHGSTQYYQRDDHGATLFQRAMDSIDAQLLDAQIDTAWALCGGEEPAAWVCRFGQRQRTLHLKDFHPPVPSSGTPYERRDAALTRDAALGDSGVVDLPSVLTAAREAGVQWLIVEHMERARYEDSLRATSISLRNVLTTLNALGWMPDT